MRMQGKFHACRLLCHNEFSKTKENKQFALNKKICFILLNEDIVLLLRFTEKVSKIKHLHAPFKAKKGERIGSDKANPFVLQLSVSYFQKGKKWSHSYKFEILINGRVSQ